MKVKVRIGSDDPRGGSIAHVMHHGAVCSIVVHCVEPVGVWMGIGDSERLSVAEEWMGGRSALPSRFWPSQRSWDGDVSDLHYLLAKYFAQGQSVMVAQCIRIRRGLT